MIRTTAVVLLALALAARLPAQTVTPGDPPGPPCPDYGVTTLHPVSVTYSGFQACDWGMIEFRFGGVTITWKDPMCPLFILIEPSWTETGQKSGARIHMATTSRGMKYNFICDEDKEACVQTTIDNIGLYPFHLDVNCGVPPEVAPPAA